MFGFFDAAAQGTLMLKKCGACGQAHHYPRAICPFCASDRTEWITAAGRGTGSRQRWEVGCMDRERIGRRSGWMLVLGLVVGALLIPAIAYRLGEHTWWPSHPGRSSGRASRADAP